MENDNSGRSNKEISCMRVSYVQKSKIATRRWFIESSEFYDELFLAETCLTKSSSSYLSRMTHTICRDCFGLFGSRMRMKRAQCLKLFSSFTNRRFHSPLLTSKENAWVKVGALQLLEKRVPHPGATNVTIIGCETFSLMRP